jgi:hypothetical protein
MEFSNWFPDTTATILFCAFMVARFENQRWVRARNSGFRGSSAAVGTIVDLTGAFALLFTIAFVLSFSFDHGWQGGIGLLASGILISLAYSLISTLMFGGDLTVLWMVGTFSVWPLAIYLLGKTTWFGFWL